MRGFGSWKAKVNRHVNCARWLLAVAIGFILLSARVQADQSSNWRIFRASDGLKDSSVTAVSVSPRGKVWVKHGEDSEITMLDGYSIQTFPAPVPENFRVYENRTGQLWSLYTNGLAVHDGKQWVQHPVAEIRAEIESDPLQLRQIRQIPLLPAERDRVLFLLSSRLMEYDAARKEVRVIKPVADTSLGKFLEMAEARDGSGVWVTGTKGLVKIPGQLRHINAQSPWLQYIPDESLQVENLQRPFENDQGGITTIASDLSSLSRRVLLKFDGTNWFKHPVPGEIIRQAWPGWDQTIWAFTINALLRFQEGPPLTMTKERTWVGQFRDLAMETNGVFWLATSEGLVRCAPYSWRTPPELDEVDAVVHAALEDTEGRLWFAAADALLLHGNGRWKRSKWPEGFEADFQAGESLYALPNGSIAIAAHDKPLLFNPATETFQLVAHPTGRKVRLIGQFKDGELCFQTRPKDPAVAAAYRLEKFNGTKFVVALQSQPEWKFEGDISCMLEAQNGDLWLGGSSGVALYQNGLFQTFGPAQGFAEEKVFCLLDVGNDRLWCGGADRILEFNGKSWSMVRSGLDRVSRLTKVRGGKIWIATARGLFSYANGSWVNNGAEEGLPSPAVSEVFEDRRGRLWAGTTRGLSLHHPDADPNPPKTLAPTVEYSGRSDDGPINIVFNAVDKWQYTPADRLLFSWRIDEGQWSPYTNAMTEVVANLGAGKHRFEVRAMDRNWNEDPGSASAELAIIIPWYKESRLMVILVCGLALVVFFAGLAVNRHLQLIRSYAEVEKIVALRTRELERANQELLHSQKMRALGTLAAGIAHDFNNILSIIKGSAQIIEGNIEDAEKIRTRVSRIKTVVEQGAGIVKSMLGLSRVSQQDFLACDLNAIVADAIKLLDDRFLHEVTIQFQAEPALPGVPAVKELIQQILLNLILNAADAMSGTGEVNVETGRMDQLPENLALSPAEASGYLYIAIRDTGCGIAADILPRIFEPFFTTKAFSTRRGTGLGLSMVYQLAKEMGYGLKVQSSIGKGSTFTIIIPVKG